MDSKTFDAIAKSLNNSVSRRRAMQGVLGGAVLAAVAPMLVPRPAEAGRGAKKRCRNQGRVYLPKGTCHCADGSCVIPCHDNPDCHCYQTTEGRGFCAGIGHTTECTSTAQCQGEEACVETCIGLVCVPPVRVSGRCTNVSDRGGSNLVMATISGADAHRKEVNVRPAHDERFAW